MSRVLLGALALPVFVLCVGVFQGLAAESAPPAERPDFVLGTSVISSGGSRATGVLGHCNGTLGQPAMTRTGVSGGRALFSGFWTLAPGVSSNVTREPGEIFADMLFQNAPNPFSGSTSVEYTISREGPVNICVFDVTGKRVRTLMDEHKSPGRYWVTWDGHDDSGEEVSPGIYFCLIEGDGFKSVKKMVAAR